MVHTPGPESAAPESPESAPADPMMAQLKFTLDSGRFLEYKDGGSTNGWAVKSGTFHFSITCSFALYTAKLITAAGAIDVLTSSGRSASGFASKPMHISAIQTSEISTNKIFSNLEITVKNRKGEILNGFTAQFIERPLPTALWGTYSTDEDPARSPSPEKLRNGADPTINLAVGVTVARPENPENLVWSRLQSFDPAISLRTPLGPFDLDASGPVESDFLATPLQGPADSGNWNLFEHDWVAAHGAAEEIVGKSAGDDGMLKMAAEWLGWNVDQTPPPAIDNGNTKKRPSQELNGMLPKGLLRTLNTEYPVLPRQCGVFS